MIGIPSAVEIACGSWKNRELVADAVEQDLSSDAGLVLLGQFDAKLGWTERFSSLLKDTRCDPKHSMKSIVQQRVFGILAAYEDQNDHDTLRSDPIFKMLVGKSPSDKDLASQPTISRLENMVKPSELLQLEQWFLDKFVESFESAPAEITLDIDTYADAAHGAQQLALPSVPTYVNKACPLSESQCAQLRELGEADPNLSLGGAIMADILKLPECPQSILRDALTSDRRHLAKIAKRRLRLD